jgi:DNA-nicking Smr family endonuclease
VKRPTKHRSVSEDEKILFRKSVAAANPRAVIKPITKKAAPKSKATALDGHTRERLKRGEGAPEARLDLHGMTQAAAHRALLSFLQKGHKKGLRLALVVTGRGNPEKESAPWTAKPHGVLKEMVPRWLNESDFAAFVTGTASAHIRHGGEGALYVYLRK